MDSVKRTAFAIRLNHRLAGIAEHAMTTGYIALTGQAFPITGFVISMLIELGRRLQHDAVSKIVNRSSEGV